MASTVDLVARASDLKRELVWYAQQPRYQRAFQEALHAQHLDSDSADDRQRIMFLDYFALQHTFGNGKTVVEQFVASRPDLTEDERQMMLRWREVVEGIFEVEGRDDEALRVKDLTDETKYRVRSNRGPEVFEQVPDGCFLIARLIPVGEEWLISGATAVVPESEREDMYRRAGELGKQR
jgi:hypothetical protein